MDPHSHDDLLDRIKSVKSRRSRIPFARRKAERWLDRVKKKLTYLRDFVSFTLSG